MNSVEPSNSIVIYQTSDGETSIDVKFKDETVWLSQAQITYSGACPFSFPDDFRG